MHVTVDAAHQVSALFAGPDRPSFLYVLAHGAGAGMRHAFLENIASALAAANVATLRYQFPYMEAGRKRPDTPALATATVRAAVNRAAERMPGVPIVAGGKSFGGRMTSTAQAAEPLPGVRGLAFLGFPLHPPGRPGSDRAAHLDQVKVPMLFLQGTRDDFAQLDLLEPVVKRLADRATLHLIENGDHSFRVPKRAGGARDVMDELVNAIREWGAALIR
ncbi:MAG TPA: alpha/beta family hydrolase [Gemmatimonadales bacterium]|nr:alpha/beta family hydrolase [Gemmatimonadales bacterium]